MKTAIIYWSGTGNTKAMAEAVSSGNASADLFEVNEFDPASASAYEAFAFGCPSMGAEQLEESEFEPVFASLEGSLSGHKVALFGSYGWGDGQWMRDWQDRVQSAGAQLVQDGIIACGYPDDDTLEQLKELGASL